MLTNTKKEHRITVSGGGSCKLTFLLVGGGGDRFYDPRIRSGDSWAIQDGIFGGGAGSGYLKYTSKMKVSPGTVLTAQVHRWIMDIILILIQIFSLRLGTRDNIPI